MNQDVLKKAIQTYGPSMQMNIAIEEMSELIKEICKFKRGNLNTEPIVEEIADVYIMLEQLKMMFAIENEVLQVLIDSKINRLEERLKHEDN